MAQTHVPTATITDDLPRIRRIGEADLRWALAEGWRDFQQLRGDFVFLPLIYPIAGYLALVLAVNQSFLPMVFPILAGLSILGPATAAGFYELARRRQAGLESGWTHFFDPLRAPSRGPLMRLTAALALLFVLWLLAAAVIFRATIGASGDLSAGAFVRATIGSPAGWTMIVVGNLVGLGFAAVTLAASVVAFPMVVDRPVGAAAAVMTSIRAARANPSAVLQWGLWVAGLLVLGALPLFLGLPIVLPVLGYATWRLYTRLVD